MYVFRKSNNIFQINMLFGGETMNNTIFNEIKKKALDEHIPIVMDDTLEYLDSILLNSNKDRILEIGTAVRIF